LVCFPHAGGSASYFFALSRLLAPAVEALAVQYPGRQDRRRENGIDNIPELADRTADALQAWTDRPFAFFGHSLGAVLAFEVARRLQGAGTPPFWLFVSGRRAPCQHRNENVHLRDDAGVVAELRRLSGTDQRVLDDKELVDLILPMTRNDYRAIETYVHVPGSPLTCPVTAFVGDADSKNTINEVSAWARHSTGEFALRVFPGGHFYLDKCWQEIASTIRASRHPLGLGASGSR
jgi:surfactin synthase thioesterase subunit